MLKPTATGMVSGGLLHEADAGLPAVVGSGAMTVPRKGIPLSALLGGVAKVVAEAFKAGAWVQVDVIKVSAKGGNVYLEVAERDGSGRPVAQAQANIWRSTAAALIPRFERATGVVLGPGIKLMIRVRPAMHALYGLSLVVDDIDPDYTLGDLEARKREIRARLQREGLFEANRQLGAPWDFKRVLVVAPEGGAGLGDFQAEARRLDAGGVCAFRYVASRFQGEGAANEIRHRILARMDKLRAAGTGMPDAVVIIRGGGAVNDLAWLNDYELARCICELDVPVLTGIGHERDSTILDEVAYQRYDTPSKVIAGIEGLIRQRAREAKSYFEAIARATERAIAVGRRAVDQDDAAVRSGALQHINKARQESQRLMSAVRLGAVHSLSDAAAASKDELGAVRESARAQLTKARATVPALHQEVRSGAGQAVRLARTKAEASLALVVERTEVATRAAREAAAAAMAEVGRSAKRVVRDSATSAEGLMREIAGQGPEKTLGRGFALVRTGEGATVSSASDVEAGQDLQISFHDGPVKARTFESAQGEKDG